MALRKTGRVLIPPFVVTVSAVLGGSACERARNKPGHAAVDSITAGERCLYHEGMSCPEGASCNPPPPTELRCDPDGGVLIENGKVITKSRVAALIGQCLYYPERYCEKPPAGTSCQSGEPIEVQCYQLAAPGQVRGNLDASPDAGSELSNHIFVKGFTTKRANGQCIRFPDGLWDRMGDRQPAAEPCAKK